MAKLVVNPGTPQAWEIQLKAGTNHVGRGATNDFKVNDLSVSGSHCQIVVKNGSAVIKDLGSTNGTFVNRSPVQEAKLEAGCNVRLGSVDMIFYSDGADSVVVTQLPPSAPQVSIATAQMAAPAPLATAPAPVAVAVAAPAAATALSIPPAAARLTLAGHAHSAHAVAPPAAPPMPMSSGTYSPHETSSVGTSGPKFCKFHPKTPARFLCEKCNRSYCELCTTNLNVGSVIKKTCRNCGNECVPLQVHLVRPDAAVRNFFALVPGAFGYPFRGSGIFSLLVLMIVVAGIGLGTLIMGSGSIRNFIMGAILLAVLAGYLFTFLQNIIHSTAAGDKDVPDLPGINFLEDIMLPFCRLAGLTLVCFGPAIALGIWLLVSAQPMAAVAIIPALILGCVYFPMAFLAVAILDSVGAVNPLAVVPSILKVPLEYLVTVVVLGGIFTFTRVGDFLMKFLFPKGMLTQSMAELLMMSGLKFFWALVTVYLLTVNMRILGLLYLSKKDKLAWIGR